MSYQLINVGDIASGGEKSQLIDEATNTSTASSTVAVSKIGDCMISGTSCNLRVKPLAVSVNSFTGATGERRLNGVTDSAFAKGKKIAYAIEARDSQDGLLEEATTSPGTLIISSVGVAGQATRKIEAKIDLSSGKYLGLFDYGVYCGKECEGLGGANQGG
jgi:hypothetical protein